MLLFGTAENGLFLTKLTEMKVSFCIFIVNVNVMKLDDWRKAT